MSDITSPHTAPGNMIDRAAQRSEAAIHTGAEAAAQVLDELRDSTREARIRARRAGARTVGYIQDEPVKSMVMAAAAGAALVLLLGLGSRARR